MACEGTTVPTQQPVKSSGMKARSRTPQATRTQSLCRKLTARRRSRGNRAGTGQTRPQPLVLPRQLLQCRRDALCLRAALPDIPATPAFTVTSSPSNPRFISLDSQRTAAGRESSGHSGVERRSVLSQGVTTKPDLPVAFAHPHKPPQDDASSETISSPRVIVGKSPPEMEWELTGAEKERPTAADGETSSARSVIEDEEGAMSRIRLPDKHVVLEKMALYQTQAVSAPWVSSNATWLTACEDKVPLPRRE